MDILDEMSKAQFARPPKSNQKPSILVNISGTVSKNMIPDKSTLIPNQSSFKPKNDITLSNPHLHSSHHFDMSNSFQKISKIESHKDAFSINHSVDNKENKGCLSQLASSLGVIASEQNSEQSVNTNNTISLRRRTSQQVNANGNTIRFDNTSPIQIEEMRDKIRQYETKNIELQFKLKQAESQLKEKQQKIIELENKIERLYIRNSEDRKQIINEQQKLLSKEIAKLTFTHEQEIRRRQQIYQWQSENKQKMLRQEINSLKEIIQKYKGILNSEQHVNLQKYRINDQYTNQRESKQMKLKRQKYQEMQKDLKAKSKDLERRITQFYQTRKQYGKENDKLRKQVDQQKLNLKKLQIQLKRQLKQKQQSLQQDLLNKTKQLEEKQRKMTMQLHQIQMMRQLIEKEKEESKRLNERMAMEHKLKMEQLIEEKERVYQFETELIKKINIVQLYAEKYPSNPAKSEKYISKSDKKVNSANQSNLYCENIQQAQRNLSRILQSFCPEQSSSQKKEPKAEHKKMDIGNYLLKVQKTSSMAKLGGTRPIYKLQQYYM